VVGAANGRRARRLRGGKIPTGARKHLAAVATGGHGIRHP
jgi:hypothetical protein